MDAEEKRIREQYRGSAEYYSKLEEYRRARGATDMLTQVLGRQKEQKTPSIAEPRVFSAPAHVTKYYSDVTESPLGRALAIVANRAPSATRAIASVSKSSEQSQRVEDAPAEEAI